MLCLDLLPPGFLRRWLPDDNTTRRVAFSRSVQEPHSQETLAESEDRCPSTVISCGGQRVIRTGIWLESGLFWESETDGWFRSGVDQARKRKQDLPDGFAKH